MGRTVELRDAMGIEITTRSGELVVIAEAGRANIEIEGLRERSHRRQVWRDGKCLHIRARRGVGLLTVRCPAGADLMAASNAGRVELRGDLGDVRLHSHSGQITVERARSVEARTMSGGIRIGAVQGRASVATTSGQVEIGEAHSARVASVSGSIDLKNVRGKVEVKSVNGTVQITTQGAGNIHVATVSGDIDVRLPREKQPNVRTKQKLGSSTIDCESGNDIIISVATVSGSFYVGNHRLRVEA